MTALFCLHTLADEAKEKPKDKPGLSLSFLEYLADLKEVDGKWVGPLDMQDPPSKSDVQKQDKQDPPQTKDVKAREGEKK